MPSNLSHFPHSLRLKKSQVIDQSKLRLSLYNTRKKYPQKPRKVLLTSAKPTEVTCTFPFQNKRYGLLQDFTHLLAHIPQNVALPHVFIAGDVVDSRISQCRSSLQFLTSSLTNLWKDLIYRSNCDRTSLLCRFLTPPYTVHSQTSYARYSIDTEGKGELAKRSMSSPETLARHMHRRPTARDRTSHGSSAEENWPA